jgi:uncharacterized damage-inducible protein DinB
METMAKEQTSLVISEKQLLEHWLGHRRLTRRVIEAFPEDKLFKYSVGGMRPFAELATEMIGMAVSNVIGVGTGKWTSYDEYAGHSKLKPSTKDELLELWDKTTEEIIANYKNMRQERWQEVDLAYGQWEGPGYWIFLYGIDNEIHHRGQGYVYLRSLGIEPPAFYER